MGTTYNGSIDAPPSTTLSISLTTQPADFFPNDRQGTLVELDALPPGKSVDGIFYFNSPNTGKFLKRVIDGPVRAVQCGIYAAAAASYNSSRLNSALSHPDIHEIVFDDPAGGVIQLTGTITVPDSTKLTFLQNNALGGDAVIAGGIINADYDQQIFQTTLKVEPKGLSGDLFSVKWFGASPSAAASVNREAMQKTLDTVIAFQNRFRKVYIPVGTYQLDGALIAYALFHPGAFPEKYSYGQVAIDIIGDFNFASGSGSWLQFTQNNTFGIGIQQGKGCTIEGLCIQGVFAPPAAEGYDWYKLSIDDFVTNAVTPARASQYSPYAGIVIDPFTNGAQSEPIDPKFYPDLDVFYTRYAPNENIQSGSTGITIQKCSISGFVVGFICSPNGVTKNAELVALRDIQFAFCQVAIANSQDQEKVNTFQRIMCWSDVHTVFVSGKYGHQVPGNWYGYEINIAGRVNRFIDNNGLGYYPSYFEKIFAEGLGQIGFLGTKLQSCIKEAAIDFAIPQGRGFIDYVIDGDNCLYQNCMLRYLAQGLPIAIKGKVYFEECYFEAPPYCPANILELQTGSPIFNNCTSDSLNFGVEQTNTIQPTFLKRTPIYGHVRAAEAVMFQQMVWEEIDIDGGAFPSREYWANVFNSSTGFAVSVNPDRTAVVNVGSLHIAKFATSKLCVTNTFRIVGVVTNVNTTTNEITISYIPPGITNANYILGCIYPKLYQGSFLGDLTANNTTITNVVFDKWGLDTSALVGSLIEFPQAMNISFIGNYQNVARIIAYRSAQQEIDLDIAPPVSQQAAYIGFGRVKKTFYNHGTAVFAPETIMTIGSEIVFPPQNQRFVVTKTGFFNASAMPLLPGGITETRQAQWREIGKALKDTFTLTGDDERTVDADTDVPFIRINPSANLAAFKIGTTSGADDVVPTQAVSTGGWTVFKTSSYFPANTVLYIEGVTASTAFAIIKL